LFSSARSGQTYSTERPDQCPASACDSSGSMTASVLPPAVGAASITSCPPSTGATADSCSGRSSAQPRVLMMWYWRAGCRLAKAPRLSVMLSCVIGSPNGSWRICGESLDSSGPGQATVVTGMAADQGWTDVSRAPGLDHGGDPGSGRSISSGVAAGGS